MVQALKSAPTCLEVRLAGSLLTQIPHPLLCAEHMGSCRCVSYVTLCPPHRGQSWSHHRWSRATQRDAMRRPRPGRMGEG